MLTLLATRHPAKIAAVLAFAILSGTTDDAGRGPLARGQAALAEAPDRLAEGRAYLARVAERVERQRAWEKAYGPAWQAK